MSSKNILFRADSSSTIGTGHIMRDLVLAEQYSDSKIIFATQDLSGNINYKIKESGYTIEILDSNDIEELDSLIEEFHIDMIMFTPEHYMTRSQDLEEAYQDAGQFYWENRKLAKESKNKIIFSDISIPIILPRHLVQDIDTLEDWKRAEFMYKILNNISDVKYLGYEVIINYGDYDTYEVIMENMDQLESICKNIEADDEYFNIEYKEKYQYDNKILYTEAKHIQIENKSIPKKYKLIKNIYEKVEDIYNNQDLNKQNVKSCILDLENLLKEME